MKPFAVTHAALAATLAVTLTALVTLAAGCTAPDYGDGHLQCAPTGACPSGFYCAGDDHCWRDGSGPPAGDDLAQSGLDDLGTSALDLTPAPDLQLAASTCAAIKSDVVLCDGFENATLSGWGSSASNGTPSRDTTRAYRGVASLHSHIGGAPVMAGPVALLHRADIFPITGTLYARVWVYFTSGLPASFEQFLNFADNSMTGYSVATDSGKVTLDDYTTGGVYEISSTPMPLDRWACVQFEIDQTSSSTAAIHIRVDGQLLADLSQTAAANPAVNLSLGLDFYGNAVAIPQYDAWFDELIIDTKPTTCDE